MNAGELPIKVEKTEHYYILEGDCSVVHESAHSLASLLAAAQAACQQLTQGCRLVAWQAASCSLSAGCSAGCLLSTHSCACARACHSEA